MSEKINVIILHYKTVEKTIECIESLLNTPEDIQIHIVDNYSNDGSLELLEKRYSHEKNVEFIKMETNVGFARANNYAMKELYHRGEKYAILSNNDIVFLAGAAGEMVRQISDDKNVLVLAPRILTPDYEIQQSVKIKSNNTWKHFLNMCFLIEEKNFVRKYNKKMYVQMFSGCCFACNLELMNDVGYMDANTFLYYEEAILSEKARENNMNIIYLPSAQVIHYHGSTTKGINEMLFFYMLDSEILYLRKYKHVKKIVLMPYIIIKRWVHKIKYRSEKLYRLETIILNKLKGNEYEKS